MVMASMDMENMDMKNTKMSKKSTGKKAKKRLLIILIILFVIIAVPFGVFEFLKASGKSSLLTHAQSASPNLINASSIEEVSGQEDDYDSSIVRYKGKEYKYNDGMITILCMGIDKDEEYFEEQDVSGESGQADTIFLIAMDTVKRDINVIAVSRDAMVMMKNYDAAGNETGVAKNHLGLAFAYGDGKEKSCELMQEAVSSLFYNLPIHGYGAILLDAIAPLNDCVGGVTITIPEDLTELDPAFVKGASVTLTGEQARKYVQARQNVQNGSNQDRMSRQRQYLLSFVSAAFQAVKKNPALVANMYKELDGQMITSIGVNEATYLASEMIDMGFSSDNICQVEGKTVQGSIYEEFHVDEDKLTQLVIDIFYDEVENDE